MNDSEMVELSKLVALEIDAVHAYAAAMAAVGGASSAIGSELDLFEVEHQRHALELYDAFLKIGQTPPEVTPDVKGVVIGALTQPRRQLSPAEVLEAVRGNERLIGSMYAKALGKGFPPDLQAVVGRILAQERRHLEWVERAIGRRLWSAAPHAAVQP